MKTMPKKRDSKVNPSPTRISPLFLTGVAGEYFVAGNVPPVLRHGMINLRKPEPFRVRVLVKQMASFHV